MQANRFAAAHTGGLDGQGVSVPVIHTSTAGTVSVWRCGEKRLW